LICFTRAVLAASVTCPQSVTVTAPGPQPGNDAVGTMANTPQTMPVLKMLANDTHPLGKAMQLTAVTARGVFVGSFAALDSRIYPVSVSLQAEPQRTGFEISANRGASPPCGIGRCFPRAYGLIAGWRKALICFTRAVLAASVTFTTLP